MTEQSYSERVLKYPVTIDDTFQVLMPPGAEVVHVDRQGENAFMWARVSIDRAAEVETRTFHVRGTGHGVEAGLCYLGTFLLHGGAFVGHLYEPDSCS